MWDEVALPIWGVIALAVLAAIAVLDRLLVPSVRLVLKRRAARAIEEINQHLNLHIQPFKLTERRVLIDRLLSDPEVMAAVEQHAAETGTKPAAAAQLARRYAREIVPAFSAATYFHIGTRLARRISQSLYRVRLGYVSDDALRAVPPDASVVFVINHRSNMDYVLVTYVASTYSALSYAVGEWAQVWGLRGLIRSMGAYFIRRNSRDKLYRRVLARYVDMATKAGVVQAVFPEGGLSRDGALKAPKLGLLSYMVSDFDPHGARDLVFIPVGLNYDRVLEDRVLTAAAATPAGETPRFRFDPLVFIGFVMKSLWLRLCGRWHRYGYACVSFGRPISLRAHLEGRGLDLRTLSSADRNAEIDNLGHVLMAAVGQVVPALPVTLVSRVLIEAGERRLTLFELKGRVAALIEQLEHAGAHVHIPRHDREYAIEVGLRILKMRRLITVNAEGCDVNPKEAMLLHYYANAIAHLLPSPSDREI